MKVFKFGGASVNSIERINNVSNILQSYRGEKLLIVISAMGKTTNALEKVVGAFHAGNKEEALSLFALIKESHLNTLKYLVTLNWKEAEEKLADFFTEVEWLLNDKPVKDYNYYYDQIVCAGELLSTSILSSFLNEKGITNTWIDVRDIFRTDDNFRDANLDWNYTQKQVDNIIQPLFLSSRIIVTQGFIGSTDENESTTLGREGSDYSAAIFANMLNADTLTIWKDVKGVMNADPREFDDAKFIAALSYDEVIEMAYYGAQVIHPKTIKPLQNKNISLHVKCFLQPELPGTVISKQPVHNLPPIIVLKPNQVLLELSSKDFSFVGMSKPWETIFCSPMAHIHEDECNAPEFYTGGAKLTLVPAVDAKITPDALRKSILGEQTRGVHGPQRGPLSVTQATEKGTVYSVAEIGILTAVAREYGMKTHMDGARFTNALVSLGCTAAEMTWKAGVDAVSFGGTKNGLMGVEAVVIFDPALAWEFELRRKRGAHLFSKHRYLSAQMLAYLTDDLWLIMARSANARLARLVAGLRKTDSIEVVWEPQANLVFARFPRAMHQRLLAAGVVFYTMDGDPLAGDPDEVLTARFVCDWSMTDASVDQFLAVLHD